MAKPEGILRKKKDNSKKNYRNAEDFAKGKKVGRPKQVWIEATNSWEKVK